VVATFVARIADLDRLPAKGTVRLVVEGATGCKRDPPSSRRPGDVAPKATEGADTDRRGFVSAPSVRLRLPPPPGGGGLTTCTLPPRFRVSVDETELPAIAAPGATVRMRARLVPPPTAAVPGAYDFARVAWFQRIGATGKAIGRVAVVAPPVQGWRTRLADWRARLSAHIQRRLPGDEGAIAAALATGDTGGIGEPATQAMRDAGLAHLLSVSGLHLSAVVAATMLMTLRLLALWPWLALRAPLVLVAAATAALAGIGYTLMTGAEVPTVRSCVASLLVLLGLALGREALTLRLVAAGALIVLAFRPEALVGPSFQLSFAAIAAIVAFHDAPAIRTLLGGRDEAWWRKGLRLLAGLLATGLLVEAALAPVALFHFHRAGLYGALANIVAIPLTTFVVMPLEAAALSLDLAGLGAPLWWLAGRSLTLLLWLAQAVAGIPGSVAMLPTMGRGAYGCMLLGGLWLALWRTGLRWWGVVPLLGGIVWAAAGRAPDLFVTGDGRHVAVRTGEGIALLRERAGDYVRDSLGELAGSDAEATTFDTLPGARCNADLCAVELLAGGRRWRLLATRSRYLVDIAAMNRACATADLVVADRRLPRSCRPTWLKADRVSLARTGGLAIDLRDGSVETVAEAAGAHPWRVEPARELKHLATGA
jgi:competence protein ComEC